MHFFQSICGPLWYGQFSSKFWKYTPKSSLNGVRYGVDPCLLWFQNLSYAFFVIALLLPVFVVIYHTIIYSFTFWYPLYCKHICCVKYSNLYCLIPRIPCLSHRCVINGVLFISGHIPSCSLAVWRWEAQPSCCRGTAQSSRMSYLDSKVHGANMGPIWGRQDPGGPHVGPMNFAIWVYSFVKLCVPRRRQNLAVIRRVVEI